MAATERPGATGRGYGVPPLSVAELVEEARKISAREVARDRQLRENQGAWSGNSAFELEAPFATRHGKLLPQETLRPKRLLTGRPHFDGAFAPEAYPSARGASPPAPVGRETRLYVVRLRDGKFFVGTFRVSQRDAADLSNLHARIEAHRRGDCQWTRRYPPAEGDDALYWFQREEKNPSRDSMGVVDTDALAERLMFERHARHGLDVVRGGSYTAAHMPDHRKRALKDAFFLRDDIACAVCGGAHASKRCGERRDAARVEEKSRGGAETTTSFFFSFCIFGCVAIRRRETILIPTRNMRNKPIIFSVVDRRLRSVRHEARHRQAPRRRWRERRRF